MINFYQMTGGYSGSESEKQKIIMDNIKKYIPNDFEILDTIYQRNNISIYKSLYKKNKIKKNFSY